MRTQINKLKSRKHWELQGAKRFVVALIFRAVGGGGTLHKRAKGDGWNVYWLRVGWNEGLQVPRAPILAATAQTFPGGCERKWSAVFCQMQIYADPMQYDGAHPSPAGPALQRCFLSEGSGRVARLRNTGMLGCTVGMYEPEVWGKTVSAVEHKVQRELQRAGTASEKSCIFATHGELNQTKASTNLRLSKSKDLIGSTFLTRSLI